MPFPQFVCGLSKINGRQMVHPLYWSWNVLISSDLIPYLSLKNATSKKFPHLYLSMLLLNFKFYLAYFLISIFFVFSLFTVAIASPFKAILVSMTQCLFSLMILVIIRTSLLFTVLSLLFSKFFICFLFSSCLSSWIFSTNGRACVWLKSFNV